MSKRSPNVLFVMADQWRAQAMGYAGDANARTPNIDEFAAVSLNFEQAVSGTPVCCPARASLMTGQYPLTHGVYINDVPLEPTGPTLGEVFAAAGYRTGYIGKWHLYGSPDGHYSRREAYIPPEKRFGFEYWKVGECTHDYDNSFYYEGSDSTKKYWPGYDAIAQTEDASAFIRDAASFDTPFFLVVSYGPPHFPLETAPEEYQEMYRGREIELRPNVPNRVATAVTEDLRGYYAHIAALDDCFARLLSALDESGQGDNTIVVFTSDHGDMMGSQGMPAEQKLFPWEESIRVPLLVRAPGMADSAGMRSSAPINIPDLMPSLLSLCSLSVPSSVQGKDYFSGGGRVESASETAFLSLPVSTMYARGSGVPEYRGVRDSRYTYIRTRRGPWLLYDNVRDPYQMHNICDSPEMRDTQKRLDDSLDIWLGVLADGFLPGEEYLRRDSLTHYMETQTTVGSARSPWGDWQSPLGDDRSWPKEDASSK